MQLQEAKALLKEDDDLIIAVYDYWLNKRLRLVEIWLLYWALYILDFKGIQSNILVDRIRCGFAWQIMIGLICAYFIIVN